MTERRSILKAILNRRSCFDFYFLITAPFALPPSKGYLLGTLRSPSRTIKNCDYFNFPFQAKIAFRCATSRRAFPRQAPETASSRGHPMVFGLSRKRAHAIRVYEETAEIGQLERKIATSAVLSRFN
jgi:hypothetical protein